MPIEPTTDDFNSDPFAETPATENEAENENNKVLPMPEASSFFIFSKDSKFRIFCHWLANHRWFGNSVLVCILVSSSLLAAEDPVRSGAPINEVIYYFIILLF
jgi:hypothetical protein